MCSPDQNDYYMTKQSLAFPSEVALLILQKNNAGRNIRAVIDISRLLHCELLTASDVPNAEVVEEKRSQRLENGDMLVGEIMELPQVRASTFTQP